MVATPFTVSALDRTHDRYASLPEPVREQAAGTRHDFDGVAWDALRAGLRSGETYAVVTARGSATGFVDEGTVVRTSAAYRLLPAIQVDRAARADAIVYVDVDPPPAARCFDPARRLCMVRRR